jgi:hypothetical protein
MCVIIVDAATTYTYVTHIGTIRSAKAYTGSADVVECACIGIVARNAVGRIAARTRAIDTRIDRARILHTHTYVKTNTFDRKQHHRNLVVAERGVGSAGANLWRADALAVGRALIVVGVGVVVVARRAGRCSRRFAANRRRAATRAYSLPRGYCVGSKQQSFWCTSVATFLSWHLATRRIDHSESTRLTTSAALTLHQRYHKNQYDIFVNNTAQATSLPLRSHQSSYRRTRLAWERASAALESAPASVH